MTADENVAIHESVSALAARLPELEWTLSKSSILLNPHALPRGLFRDQLEMTPQTCVDEIKADLHLLSQQGSGQRAFYLARRLMQKINVLVQLCQSQAKQAVLTPLPVFSLDTISTRQQWLKTIKDDMDKLRLQREAIKALFEKSKSKGELERRLKLEAELGEIERRLTLAEETWMREVNQAGNSSLSHNTCS